jgi:hypothetical protein
MLQKDQIQTLHIICFNGFDTTNIGSTPPFSIELNQWRLTESW